MAIREFSAAAAIPYLWSVASNWVGGIKPSSGDTAMIRGKDVLLDEAPATNITISNGAYSTGSINTYGNLTMLGDFTCTVVPFNINADFYTDYDLTCSDLTINAGVINLTTLTCTNLNIIPISSCVVNLNGSSIITNVLLSSEYYNATLYTKNIITVSGDFIMDELNHAYNVSLFNSGTLTLGTSLSSTIRFTDVSNTGYIYDSGQIIYLDASTIINSNIFDPTHLMDYSVHLGQTCYFIISNSAVTEFNLITITPGSELIINCDAGSIVTFAEDITMDTTISTNIYGQLVIQSPKTLTLKDSTFVITTDGTLTVETGATFFVNYNEGATLDTYTNVGILEIHNKKYYAKESSALASISNIYNTDTQAGIAGTLTLPQVSYVKHDVSYGVGGTGSTGILQEWPYYFDTFAVINKNQFINPDNHHITVYYSN